MKTNVILLFSCFVLLSAACDDDSSSSNNSNNINNTNNTNNTNNVTECLPGCDVNASCVEGEGTLTCVCNNGYSGDGLVCTDIDECTDGTHDCDVNATCTNTEGGYTCECDPPYVGDGVMCVEPTDCTNDSSICDENATCTDQGGNSICLCDEGYQGDGLTCADIDECVDGTDTCDPNAACTNTDGGYTCACETGFTGDGETCTDIDECADGTHNCDIMATCTNTPGAFTCECNSGYSGDGTSCTDVDECTDGTDTCDPNAACTNDMGGFTCVCNTGYSGDGFTCTDDDECSDGTDTCDPMATCTNTPGAFTCACNSGYSGDGFTCTDNDECTDGTDNCDAMATCTNTVGSFSCVCNPGYFGDGVTCTDIDECADGTDDCDPQATCTNTPGTWTCTCPTGMVDVNGDGTLCTNSSSCQDVLLADPSATSGIYTLTSPTVGDYDAYCDMDIEGGGWTRIIKTTAGDHNWGQMTTDIVSSFATVDATDGPYEAFDNITEFSEVMIVKRDGLVEVGNFAAFDLVTSVSGRSMLQIIREDCRDADHVPNDDTAHDGPRVERQLSDNTLGAWTSSYSGTLRPSSTLQMKNPSNVWVPVQYFFLCGVNESSDNDQSVMAFTDATGDNNTWSDYWRDDHQWGAIWSFWAFDYHYDGEYAYHIGNPVSAGVDEYIGWAGYKGGPSSYESPAWGPDHAGTYEIYLR